MANPLCVNKKTISVLVSALLASGALGTATAQTPPAGPAGVPGAAGPAAAAARPDAAAPRPFADIIKDAKQIPGYFNVYQKDEKVWIEVKPDQFETPFFFQINSTRGMGEAGVYPNWMLRGHIVEFKKLGSTVQLIARNNKFIATPGTPIARAVKESFTDSLLAVTAAASAPHPERKSILIDANALLLADIPGTATRLEAAFRLPYAYDARNSGFLNVRSTENMTSFNVTAHYGMPKLPAPPATPSPVPTPPPPSTLEDNRSMFLGYYYSFAKLPDKPMAPRMADSRVGHFVTQKWNFSDDIAAVPRQYIVNH